jgi:hypothetical protein
MWRELDATKSKAKICTDMPTVALQRRKTGAFLRDCNSDGRASTALLNLMFFVGEIRSFSILG